MKGIGVCPGIVYGKVFIYKEVKPKIKHTTIRSVEDEIKRLEIGLNKSIKEIEKLHKDKKNIGNDIDILIAHMEIFVITKKRICEIIAL